MRQICFITAESSNVKSSNTSLSKKQSKALVLHSDSELDLLFFIHRLRSQLFSVQDNCGASVTIILTLTVIKNWLVMVNLNEF